VISLIGGECRRVATPLSEQSSRFAYCRNSLLTRKSVGTGSGAQDRVPPSPAVVATPLAMLSVGKRFRVHPRRRPRIRTNNAYWSRTTSVQRDEPQPRDSPRVVSVALRVVVSVRRAAVRAGSILRGRLRLCSAHLPPSTFH